MTLNALIQPERPAISDIIGKMRNDAYFVDNSFQRRLVWTERQKIRLIETVLMGYPMPEVYLWQQVVDSDKGIYRHSIVDGQQRLSTINQFISNEFKLVTSALDDENSESEYAGKYWRELSSEDKDTIWKYVINVRQIPSSVTKEQIRKLFRRLNETDRSLNPQELRNAEFNGEFISNCERVANLDIWKKWEFFKTSQVRRMADIEFAANLLLVLRSGVVSGTAASINKVFDLYNDVYEEKDADLKATTDSLEKIDRICSTEELKQFFLIPVHLYSLFCIVNAPSTPKLSDDNLRTKLASFVKIYRDTAADEDLPKNSTIEAYREGASSRTASKSSRDKRVDNLLKWIKTPN